jgi:hypothetical protein
MYIPSLSARDGSPIGKSQISKDAIGGGNELSAWDRSIAALARARAALSAGCERAIASASAAQVGVRPETGSPGRAAAAPVEETAATSVASATTVMK